MGKGKKILDTTTNHKEYKLVRRDFDKWCEPYFVVPRGSCRLCKICNRMKPRNWKNYRRHQWRNTQSSNATH